MPEKPEKTPAPEASLPPELLAQFEVFRRRLLLSRGLLALGFGAGAVFLSFLILFFSDRATDTPVFVRWCLFGFATACAGFACMAWMAARVRRKDEAKRLARLVQQRHPQLGDRLLGIVELASGESIPDGMSPALCRAAIRQVAGEAAKSDFTTAVDWRRTRWVGVSACVAGTAFVVVWCAAFDASRNTLLRWALPGANIPRYTFVAIEGLPPNRVVAHGEPFEVRAVIRPRSFWKPASAEVQVGSQFPLRASISNGVALFKIGGQTDVQRLTVRAGDAVAGLQVQPVTRPSLKSLESTVQLPAYLTLPDQTAPVAGGALSFVKGSRALFRGEASRPLTNATLGVGAAEPTALKPTGARFASDWVSLDGLNDLSFRWSDEFGLSNAAPWKLTLQEIPDEAPRTAIQDLASSTALLISEVLEIHANAQDDFGVSELSLKWEATNPDGASVSSGESPLFVSKPAGPSERQFEHAFRFSPVLLGIKEDSVVELRSRALDRFPGRAPSESSLYRIHVVSPERHAEIVRQHLESILTRVEDITRQEESLMHATQALAERKDIESAEAASKAAELAEQQDINSRNLEETSKDGARVLKEAMKNATFSQQNLREWAKNLGEMKKVSQQQMQQAKSSLQQAKNDASQRQAQAKNAAEKEEESLRALEQMQKRMNTGLDNLQALTLAQRLKRLASEESRFQTGLVKMAPDVVGLLPDELTPRQRAQESEAADDQIEVQGQTLSLQGEISRFFDRTQNAPYGEVSKEMADAKISFEMDRISGLIRSNIIMDASQDLGGWSKRLNEWASRLEPKPSGEQASAASGSGENGNPDEALKKQMMALLRLRDREATTLSMTQTLEQQRATDGAYAEKAKVLAKTQLEISGDFRQARIENRLPVLAKAYEEAFEPIRTATELLEKPQTDQVTQKAEQGAIEQLTDLINLINEMTQNGPKSQSSSEESAEAEMEMMMQMAQQPGSNGMSMEAKDTPGFNSNGGTTNARSEGFKGSVQGRAATARSQTKIGSDTKNFPAEFRQALENYFRALEKEGLQ